MMYINLPNKRKKETAYVGRVKMFFYLLKMGNKKKIPFLRKKGTPCPKENGECPYGELTVQNGISAKLGLRKHHLKRKLSHFLSMML